MKNQHSPKDSFKALVVGAPRSGFTLLISVLSELRANRNLEVSLPQQILNSFIEHNDYYIAKDIQNVFRRHGLFDNLIYNGNFQRIGGGPKWLHPERRELGCFRKYIGVRGMGDFTLIIAHPKETLNYDRIVHSHVYPEVWLEEPSYADFDKFHSIRNPIGILNSSIFSINALTSEYIQRFIPAADDNDSLRQYLAKYKLTDPNFFEGLITYLKGYLENYLKFRDRYIEMKWEDLILEPEKTICRVGADAGLDVSSAEARQIWGKIGHVNLTGFHKHNFRVGKGKVGDWKNWLVNEHMEMIEAGGLAPIIRELGYGEIPRFNSSEFNHYQKEIAEHLGKGTIFNDYPDQDLFGFSFNKTNIDTSKFPHFRKGTWNKWTLLERSCFQRLDVEQEVVAVAEKRAEQMNLFFNAVIHSDLSTPAEARLSLDRLRKECAGMLEVTKDEYEQGFAKVKQLVELASAPQPSRPARRSFGRRVASRVRRIFTELR